MKKLTLSFLLTAILAFVPNLGIYAQSGCDVVFDFEDGVLNASFENYHNLSSVVYASNPYTGGINSSSTVLKIESTTGHDFKGIYFSVTIPDGKTFAEMYTKITFQHAAANDGVYGKNTFVSIGVADSQNKINWSNTYDGNPSENITTTWYTREINVSNLNQNIKDKTGTFYLGIGIKSEEAAANKAYYLDNVTLVGIDGTCAPADPAEDATLSDLTISGTTISGFSSSKTEYSIAVANNVEKITIGATVNKEGATFQPAAVGEKALELGLNTFTITVTAPDRKTTKTYTINVTRKDVVECGVNLDFEDGVPAIYEFSINVTGAEIVDNPAPNTVNGSSKVLKLTKNSGSEAYIVFKIKTDSPIPVSFKTVCSAVRFDIYTPGGGNVAYGVKNDQNEQYNNHSWSANTEWRSFDEETTGNNFGSWVAGVEGTEFWIATGIKFGESADYFFIDNIRLATPDGVCLTPAADVTWVGDVTPTDWHKAENWDPQFVPNKNINATIPGKGAYTTTTGTSKTINNFPILTSLTPGECKTITFQPGGELTNQQYLTVAQDKGATVQFELSKTSRLHMLSLPVESSRRDFQFKYDDSSNPLAFLLKFTPKQDGANTVADWEFINEDITDANKTNIAIGEPFIAAIAESDNNYLVSISGQLTKNDASVTVTFAEDGPNAGSPSYFAHVGNPYIASIDFDVLYNANSNKDVIKNGYLVWTVVGTDEGFAGYNELGSFGLQGLTGEDIPSRYIAPLQSFYVERKDAVTSATASLSFPLSITDGASGKGTLRSAASESFGKLDIVADNGTVPVKAFIANKEGAESARKLKTGCGSIPDIYTLGDDNATALGANIINTDNAISVPLGIATKTKGLMSLTFSGMSSFDDVNITLIDNVTGETTPLTGDSYPYEFDYTPPTNDNGEVIANESRFAIAFSPKNVTALDGARNESLSVYAKNNVIHIISSSADPIRQISVWDMQGRMFLIEDNLNTSVFTLNGLQFNAADIYIVKVITEKGVKNVKVINK